MIWSLEESRLNRDTGEIYKWLEDRENSKAVKQLMVKERELTGSVVKIKDQRHEIPEVEQLCVMISCKC